MWLNNFEVVLEDRIIKQAAVRIEGGTIAEISETPVPNADVEGGGLLLMPGFIDMHGDMIEKKVEPRPSVRMPMRLAVLDLDRELACCGITTAFASVTFAPVVYDHVRSTENTMAIIRSLADMRDELLVDHRVHARFEVLFPSAVETADSLRASGLLALISLMDHTPGQGQYRHIEAHIASLSQIHKISEAEAAKMVSQRMAEREEASGAIDVINGLAEFAHEHGIALASHDDDSIEKVHFVKDLGASICEFPITLQAASEARRLGMATAMGAPNALRGLSYSGNLSAREAFQADALDILASDYHPSAILPAIVALGSESDSALVRAVALATSNPAKALRLSDRGRIAQGLRADLVIGERADIARPRATLCAGRPIWSDGTLTFPANT
ncbi:alpha-D-ribose 1-methylphosphonate 5-triphosphate diphosphatase [Rhizobium sp.]